MGFYSPEWVRRLIKEEAQQIADYVNIKDSSGKFKNDFRSYIDATLPFVLWLDIDEIEERVLRPRFDDIYSIAASVYSKPYAIDIAFNVIYNILYNAYVVTINQYAQKYPKIKSLELQTRLNELKAAELGFVGKTIAKNFSRSVVIEEVTKPNKSVMIIFPKFTTVKFGEDFKKNIDLSALGERADYIDSPRNIIKSILSGKDTGVEFFRKLQNVGHIETDVISTGSREVLRGQSSPRLIQALVATNVANLSPANKTKVFSRLSSNFSKSTGQAKTRLVIRKRFSGSKMVFEALIEAGMSVGLPETQETNLLKAGLERAFTVGAGLTAEIRKNPSILTDMETSRSFKQYALSNIAAIFQKGKELPLYTSTAKFASTAKIELKKVVLPIKSVQAGSKKRIPSLPDSEASSINLLAILQAAINQKVAENMGDGDQRRILNYRTGRFAESVKVERISESRQGMITAFYSYMKNPYATFSEGGKQQYPKTRDPKLLISKSIREIAAKIVGNRLRSVVV